MGESIDCIQIWTRGTELVSNASEQLHDMLLHTTSSNTTTASTGLLAAKPAWYSSTDMLGVARIRAILRWFSLACTLGRVSSGLSW